MKFARAIATPIIPITSARPGTPGGNNDVLLLANNADGLLLTDGASFLKLASSS